MPTRETLLALRERVLKAEGADRELDADLMLRLGLLTRRNRMADCPEQPVIWEYIDPVRNAVGLHPVMVPNLSNSIDDALRVFDRLLPGWSRDVGKSGFGDLVWCRAWNPLLLRGISNHGIREEREDGCEALAILAALLTALASPETTDV